jgi:hypothetical protein
MTDLFFRTRDPDTFLFRLENYIVIPSTAVDYLELVKIKFGLMPRDSGVRYA